MMIGHLQGGKTVRDALFLTYFNATDLPKMEGHENRRSPLADTRLFIDTGDRTRT
ncbi:hypothetical protein D1AOALGA4SA_9433 [Olavius algarvensis Delta 1 endosymbiont]|nr:hypothetical protein D1AOALGA4SA_9433 [Olavius algarvensis Delta 1 endosymbiont]